MLPELGASLAVQHASSCRVTLVGDTATMHEHVPDQSELRCGFVLERSRWPKRAQQRPPRADVGVWAVTRPSAGSK